jgi:hypothetical protein
MKRFVLAAVVVLVLFSVAANAQTVSECSSISQKFGEAPVIEGSVSPANILMQVVDTDSFLVEVNANPGFTTSFVQLVYTDNVSTHVLIPGPSSNPPEDISTHWSTTVTGTFEFYKVSGCLAQQASTTTSESTTSSSVPPTTTLSVTTAVSSPASNAAVATAVPASPAFTG